MPFSYQLMSSANAIGQAIRRYELDFIRHILDSDLGPIVTVTIGLSFAEEERRRVSGRDFEERKSYVALIDPGIENTVISERIRLDYAPGEYGLEEIYFPLLGTELRLGTHVYIGVPELIPYLLERELKVIVAPLSESIHCILGRDFLNVIEFVYDGDAGVFAWRVPSPL